MAHLSNVEGALAVSTFDTDVVLERIDVQFFSRRVKIVQSSISPASEKETSTSNVSSPPSCRMGLGILVIISISNPLLRKWQTPHHITNVVACILLHLGEVLPCSGNILKLLLNSLI
jgi:hypothetical protein